MRLQNATISLLPFGFYSMLSFLIPRGLSSTAALSARATQLCESATRSSRTCAFWSAHSFQSHYGRHNALPQRPSHRSFSTTKLALSSSPFRLSSKNTPAPDEAHYEREAGEEGEDGYYSPYQPKRQWPPDMSKLSPKHQFRLERKYRRRAALKYARPRWVKATKLVQWGVIAFVVVYAVLFMEWDTEGQDHPFAEFRKEVFATLNSIFSSPAPPGRRTDNGK